MYSLNERIEVNPAVCHGKPVVRGTRVLVAQLLGALARLSTFAPDFNFPQKNS